MSEYFVNPDNGLDKNPGSRTAPWRTLSYAVGHMTDGDTLWLCGGTYGEGCVIRRPGLALRALPGQVNEIRSAKRDDVIFVNQAERTTLNGLCIYDAKRAGVFATQANGLQILGGYIGRCQTQGIITGSTSNSVIRDIVIEDIKEQHAIYESNGGDNNVVSNVTARRVGRCGVQFNGDGVAHLDTSRGTDGDGKMTSCIVEDCDIEECGLDPVMGGAAINMMMAPGAIVRGNKIQNAHAGGINIGLDDVVAGNEAYYSLGVYILGNDIDATCKRGISVTKGSSAFLDRNVLHPNDGPCVAWDKFSAVTFGPSNDFIPGGGHKQLSTPSGEMSLAAWLQTQGVAA